MPFTQFIYDDQIPCGLRSEYAIGFDALASASLTGFWRPAFIFYN